MYKMCYCTVKNALTLIDIHLTLLQIQSMPIGAGMSLTMILLNKLIRGMVPEMNRDSSNVNNADLHHKALETYQRKSDKGKDT